MSKELTNLVPQDSIQAFRRTYFLRLATVALLFLTVLAIINALLLVPTYLYARDQVNTESLRLDHLTKSLATSEEQAAQTELSNLKSEAEYLSKLSTTATASSLIQAILAVPHQGTRINGFTFTAPVSGTPGTLQIAGVSNTRESLRAYDQSLSSLPFVTSADLPISDYASDSNIPFTITLTGTLHP